MSIEPDRAIKIPLKGHRKPASRSVVSLGQSSAAGMSYGPEESWPSVFAHAMGWDMVFSEESGGEEGAGRKRQEGREKKSSEGVWWPHVTLVAQCFGIAGSYARH